GDGGTCPKEISCLSEPTAGIIFSCCFCTHVTRDQHGILTHLVDHGDEQLKCQHCFKLFSKQDELRGHTEIHKPERIFGCQLCPAAFWKNSPLCNHIQTHTGDKPLICQQCLLTPQCSCLSSHIQDQTGKKSFKCELCPQAFSENAKLIRHVRTHTGKKP
ncbi:unnamed protein product, partial [Ixodes persulcatus]